MATEKPYVYTTYKKIRLENNIVERCEKKVSDFYDKHLQFFYQESVTLAGSSATDEVVGRLEAERVQLYGDLQRCMYEIQQRDQFFQQLNTKVEAEPRFSDARLKTLVYFRNLSPSHLPPHSVSPFSACSYNKLWRRKVPVQLSWELFPKHWGTHRTAATG